MDKEEFLLHREKISSHMPNNSIMILFAPKEGENKYNPDRNFFYSTGIKESRDILVLYKSVSVRYETLFIQPYNPEEEKWVGRTLNTSEASEISGIKDIRYIDSFESYINNILNDSIDLFLDFNREDYNDSISYIELFSKNIKSRYPFVNIKNARPLLKHARTIKTDKEIEEIKKAIHITNLGIKELMINARSGIYEYQLETYFDSSIKWNGANGYSFDTIAASGINGCCLHYSSNNSIIEDNSLILFDLGATYNYYCADISRTFPINGKFSPRQKEIYEIVLNGQKLMFENIKPGITQRDLNKILVDYFAKELKRIGLIKEDSEVSKYYYHGVSHHLGLDCHDLCDYGPLEAGAVISNEPGLYIPEENIGIRIEDDVLVTEDGCINLSEEIIKEIKDIESFMEKNNKYKK